MEKLVSKDNPRHRRLMEISKLRDPDLKAAAIERGYPLDKIKNGSLAEITTFLLEHYDDPTDTKKLKAAAKLGSISKTGVKLAVIPKVEKSEPKIKKPKGAKRVKNTELGIYAGTKKEYTYFLARDLYKKFSSDHTKKELVSEYSDQVVTKVEKKFGSVSEKSIKIWMKRCLDTLTE